MITVDIVTLFPNLFTEHLKVLPIKKALEKNLISINFHNLREFAIDKHGTVDNKPYGGGKGMLLMVEPIYKALKHIYNTPLENAKSNPKQKIIVLSPSGKKYTQNVALELTKQKQITLICGRYEGIDARVKENYATDVISIGEYILSGGELPAMVILESVTRLLPGILEEEALEEESFSNNHLEYPQYTRPENFKGLRVPKVLLSGHHQKIADWKEKTKPPLAKG